MKRSVTTPASPAEESHHAVAHHVLQSVALAGLVGLMAMAMMLGPRLAALLLR